MGHVVSEETGLYYVSVIAQNGFLSIDTHETAKVVVTAQTRNPLPQQSSVALHAILEGN